MIFNINFTIDHTYLPIPGVQKSGDVWLEIFVFVRVTFSTMSEYSPKIIQRPSKCSRRQ